jgi:hypothetical protein
MASEFVSRMNDFLDLEAYGEGYAEYGLDMGYDFLSDKGSGDIRLDRENLLLGEDAALDFLKSRVFPGARNQDFRELQNARLEKVLRGEPQCDEELSVMLDRVEETEAFEEGFYRDFASHLGVSIDEAKRLLETKVAEAHLQELRKPALHRALIRRFLTRLDKMVDEIQRYSLLEISSDCLPRHLQILISDAHEAGLIGQEVACAVLCGTALEEALKLCLGRDSFEGLSAGIKLAGEKAILAKKSPEELAAWDVKKMRDLAAHDPGSYLADPGRKKRDVLINTRFVLGRLFAGEKQ